MWHRLVGLGLLILALTIVAGSVAAPGVAAQAGTATPTAGFIGLPEGISAWRVSEFTQASSLYRFQFEPGARLPGTPTRPWSSPTSSAAR
jgi:hypothetical protein